jgi:hypothetical protein
MIIISIFLVNLYETLTLLQEFFYNSVSHLIELMENGNVEKFIAQ